ncbi:MAG: RDD family protein [Bacteroidetes bacterium]|nr:MAG: RDD family protein [Bacteroidota bacterium]
MDYTMANQDENHDTDFYQTIKTGPVPVSVGIRFLTFLIDSVFLQIVNILLRLYFLESPSDENGPNGGPNLLVSSILYIIILCVYYFLCEWATGRTIGKIITGTKVVDASGEKPGLGTIVVRTLCRCVPFEPLSFFAGVRGWHDRWSDTYVVKVTQPD